MSDAYDSSRLVVAGTDTEIGKTTVACCLLAAWSGQGRKVYGIKPVESGTAEQSDRNDEDGRRLARASGQQEPREALQRLKAPLAPPVAARDEGVELTPRKWFETIDVVAEDAEMTLVEGAGGLLSPLADGIDTRTTAQKLNAPVILVASDSLGTLNHTFLTMEALQQAGIEVVGVVFSAPESPDASTGRNADVVATRFPALPVATLPRLETVDEGARALRESGFCDAVIDVT